MKESRFTEEQIAFALRQAESGTAIEEITRKLGESEREALAAYPRYHAEVEREIAEARLGRVRSEAASKAGASERVTYPTPHNSTA